MVRSWRVFFLFSLGLIAGLSPLCASAREMESLPVVKLQSLDKITARTITFEARVGSTIKFGPLYIKVQACQKAPPIEPPEAAAFLQIWQVTPKNTAEWIFSGWMFASSPALSYMDHPVYDVWVLDCLEKKTRAAAEGETKTGEGVLSEDKVPSQPAIGTGEKDGPVKPRPAEVPQDPVDDGDLDMDQ